MSFLGGVSARVNVVAAENSTMILMDFKKLLKFNDSLGGYHSKAIENFVSIVAQKNLYLTKKIDHLCQRTTRQKIISYLSEESQKAGSNKFEIPFNRQELADFLSVDRSAMSNELSKLRQEGKLDYKKNNFTLV